LVSIRYRLGSHLALSARNSMITQVTSLRLPITNGQFANNEVVLETPVVLAPMAGITNSAFRTLCREQGAGLFVSEMVTARALIERHPETMRLITPGVGETPRSVQLYAVDPTVVGQAIELLGSENLADHIDLNFGCPVPKVTRRGGGAALPFKRNLFSAIVGSSVRAASKYGIPVTVKMRVGIDSEHHTYLDAAKSAADLGVAWVALHARTAAQMYEGQADWSRIAALVEHLAPTGVPVLGNGDIWSGADGLRMVQETGCAGVVVGRGCLGRPWLFADLVAAFNGEQTPALPTLFEVRKVMYRHGELLVEFFESEGRAMRDLRKHMAWYLKGFSVPRELRAGFGMVKSLGELGHLLSQLEDQPYPAEIAEAPRGRRSHGRAVSLPDGWLNDPDEFATITIDDAVSGG
jgi:nifR3 family TIM-barrel protein